MGEVGLHGAVRNEQPGSNVPVGQAFGNKTHHIGLGRCERLPAAGGTFALAAPPLDVRDGLVDRHNLDFSPRGGKSFTAERISRYFDRRIAMCLVQREARHPGPVADRGRGTEEPRGRPVFAIVGGEELDDTGQIQERAVANSWPAGSSWRHGPIWDEDGFQTYDTSSYPESPSRPGDGWGIPDN